MKEQSQIPTGKVERATRFVQTGAKIGGNYLKHYAKKLVTGDDDREALDKSNAEDIYNSLSELKGSALKVAQMLSMDQGMLPKAYSNQFAMAQYQAPPLSYPLVVKTFRQQLNQSPEQLFTSFSRQAAAAASIGQVHHAKLGEKSLAVKIQYPGVANSIVSDLRLIKPIAKRMFNLKESDLNHYLDEVQARLLEECDYHLELDRSLSIAKACSSLNNVHFPTYYKEFSSERILAMEWLPGKHLGEFLKTNPSQEVRNTAGQALWDFYQFQIHKLKTVHADPHPGNFLFQENGKVGVVDFGCVKVLEEPFYSTYFQLLEPGIAKDTKRFTELLYALKYLLPEDSADDVAYYYPLLATMVGLLCKPFSTNTFNFSDNAYFDSIYALSQSLAKDSRLRKANGARGPKDALYVNRTYFGLYSILHELGAEINTGH